MRRLCLCGWSVSIRAARGAAAARCGRAARRGVSFTVKARKVPRSRWTPGRASRGGIRNSFGGSGGLLVRHGDWCCCFLSLGLRARVRVDSCGSFAGSDFAAVSEAPLPALRASSARGFARARQFLQYRTPWLACLGARSIDAQSPRLQAKDAMTASGKRKPAGSGRPRSGHGPAARRRTSPRSTPGEKLALGQVHQSD